VTPLLLTAARREEPAHDALAVRVLASGHALSPLNEDTAPNPGH